ncbi:MAG: hypothetical protein HYT94_03475 [Parcubacteria group bacterium]|nr:hypothetical protein [Parcubacteria group bacterium]
MTHPTKTRAVRTKMEPRKKTNRHKRICLPEKVLFQWNLIALVREQELRQALEQAVRDMELLYANIADGEVTTLIHKDGIITPLTPVFLLWRTLSPTISNARTKNIRIQISPDTYFRAQNVAQYLGLPMNMVFSLAVNIDIILSDTSVREIKISRHPSFFPPDLL